MILGPMQGFNNSLIYFARAPAARRQPHAQRIARDVVEEGVFDEDRVELNESAERRVAESTSSQSCSAKSVDAVSRKSLDENPELSGSSISADEDHDLEVDPNIQIASENPA